MKMPIKHFILGVVLSRICLIASLWAGHSPLPAQKPNPIIAPFAIGSGNGIPIPNVSLLCYRDFVYLGGATVSGPLFQARRFRTSDGQVDDWSLTDGAFLFAGAENLLVYATFQAGPPAPTLVSAINVLTQESASYVLKVADDIGCLEAQCPYVAVLAVGQGWCYVGGSFSTNSPTSLFRFDVQGGVVESVNVDGIYDISVLEADERQFYAASRRIGTGPPGRLVGVAHDDISRTQWSLEVSDAGSLLLKDGRLWVGGNFQTIGGVPRSRLASVDPQTGVVQPDTAALQFAFAPSPQLVIAGELGDYLVLVGHFSAVNGHPRNRIAAVNPLTGEVHPWNPGFGKDASGRVTALVATDRHVYVAGHFSEIGGLPRQNFAVFDLIAPPEMSAPKLEATGFIAQVKAASTYAHVLQRSGDLGLWENVSTNTPTTAEFTVSDPAPAATERYYRILLQ